MAYERVTLWRQILGLTLHGACGIMYKTVDSVEELVEVIEFIDKMKKFLDHYAEWLQHYPSFMGHNTLTVPMNMLLKTIWYIEQHVNQHFHCDTCGKNFKFVDMNKYVLRCRCGGELWLCTYREPSDRCDTCPERFKCLTNRTDEKLISHNLHDLEDMDNYKVIAEY